MIRSQVERRAVGQEQGVHSAAVVSCLFWRGKDENGSCIRRWKRRSPACHFLENESLRQGGPIGVAA